MSWAGALWRCAGAVLGPHEIPRIPPRHAPVMRFYLTEKRGTPGKEDHGCSLSPSPIANKPGRYYTTVSEVFCGVPKAQAGLTQTPTGHSLGPLVGDYDNNQRLFK